jgi:hypothetical protein
MARASAREAKDCRHSIMRDPCSINRNLDERSGPSTCITPLPLRGVVWCGPLRGVMCGVSLETLKRHVWQG